MKTSNQITITNVLDGADGSNARLYMLEPSTLVIKKSSDNRLSPAAVTFSAYYRDGTGTERTAYSGRFLIAESTDGTNFTNKYTSSADEAAKTYTPSAASKALKCTLYAGGGTSRALDVQTVVILTDIDNLEISGRNLLQGSGTSSEIIGTGAANTVGCQYELTVPSSAIQGKQTVFACEWAYEGNTPAGTFYWQTVGTTNASVTSPVTIASGKVSGQIQQTFTPAASGSFTALRVRTDGVKGKLVIRNPRLYLGMKDIGWTPAPEDFDAAVGAVTSSVSSLETKVNQNTKEITTKITQNDMTTAINNYDGSKISAIREQVSSTTESIKGINTSVGLLETKVEEKADGSTVKQIQEDFTDFVQNEKEFRTSVASTYATNNSLNNYPTTAQMKSEIDQKADTITSSVKEEIDGVVANATDLKQTVDTISGTVTSIDGRVGDLEVTAGKITAELSDANGNITSLKSEVGKITTTVTSNGENISDLQQTAKELSSTVTLKKDIDLNNIRYVRDWLKRSSANEENRWVNCQIWGHNEDYAEGLTPAGYANFESPAAISVSNPGNYTAKSSLEDNNHKTQYSVINSSDWCCLQLDLGEIKKVDYIIIWHYFADERQCEHKLQVSRDGKSWYTLYDSTSQGRYVESVDGKVYILNDTYIVDSFSNITQDFNGIKTLVSNTGTAIKTWDEAVKELAEKANNNTEKLSDMEAYKTETNTSIGALTEKYTSIESDLKSIHSTVQSFDENYASKTEVSQSETEWKVRLSQIGLYDESDIVQQETNFTVSSKGAVLSNGKDQEICLVANDEETGLFGKYNDKIIFQVTQDLTIAERFQAKNGMDCLTIKLVPKTYTKDGKTLGALMHVKSGGTS